MYPISQIKMVYFNFFFFSPYICAWIIQIQRSLFSAGGKLFGTCVFYYCMARSVIFSTSIQTKAFTVRCIIIKKPKKAIYVLELQQEPQKSKKSPISERVWIPFQKMLILEVVEMMQPALVPNILLHFFRALCVVEEQ